jgi:hypothetical protein
MQPVSKQQISKHASTTTKLLLETVFCIRSVQSGYKGEILGNQLVDGWQLSSAVQGKLVLLFR